MANQVVRVIIKSESVGEQNIKKITNSLVEMNKSLKSTSAAMAQLKNLSLGLGGISIFGFGLRELVDMADQTTLVRSRIQAFTGDINQTNFALDELNKLAKDTKSSFVDTKESFSRILTSTNRLNLSISEQIALTKILQQSFRLSGATQAESTAATIQLSQALSFGALRGQELRSVLSQNSVLAGVFTKAIEGTNKSIFKFAEEGGFTTQFVLNALANNFDRINNQAGKLSQTFGQSLTLATNEFVIAIDSLNKEFKLNEGFAAFVDFLLKNKDSLLNLFITLGVTAIPMVVSGVRSLTVAVATFTAANPFLVVLSALSFILLEVSGGVRGLMVELKTFPAAIESVILDITKMTIAFLSLGTSLIVKDPFTQLLDSRLAALKQFQDGIREEFRKESVTPLRRAGFIEGGLSRAGEDESAKRLRDASKKAGSTIKKTYDQLLAELNTQLVKGLVKDIDAFNEKFEKFSVGKFNQELTEGKISAEEFKKKVREVEIGSLGRQLDFGTISLQDFQMMIDSFHIDELTTKFQKGKISVGEFTEGLAKLQGTIDLFDITNFQLGAAAGLSKGLEDIGNVAQETSRIVQNSFQSMENSIFNMLKNSQIDFSDFVQSVLDDITRMVIRLAVIAPIAQGFLSMMGLGGGSFGGFGSAGGGSGANIDMAANGAAYSNGVKFFAKGGIVNSPIAFGTSQGMGIAGEAGPEAILPLRRGAGGSLGVAAAPVQINIINQAGVEIQQSETQGPDGVKLIELLVLSKVKDGIAKGSFDQSLKASYGLQRRGT